ncbi:hypothetical protein BH11PAT3_BH11PAT3_1290 [soil metagenome]
MNPDEKPPEGIDPSSPLKQIRTYQGDVANALHTQHESIVSIQRAEVARTAEVKLARKPESLQNIEAKESSQSGIFLSLGIILLLALGAGGGYYAYTGYKTKTAVPVVTVIPNAFFGTDSLTNFNALNLTRESLIQAVLIEQAKTTGGIEQIELRKGEGDTANLLYTEGFFAILQSHAPSSLLRAYDPLFMFGTLGTPKHMFLIIKLDSYENAYAGMLEWEHSIALDILPLFGSAETVASVPSDTPFVDITIQNKDARILKSPNGKTVLLYSFFDNNMLIIADNEETLKSLMTRLASEKLTR